MVQYLRRSAWISRKWSESLNSNDLSYRDQRT